jgi:uncharacterized tellurite resistance protein B-like protein
MGLFDKLLGGQGSENITFTKQESVAGVLFLTVAADGNISDEERELFIGTSNRMKLLRSQNADEFNAMIAKIRGVLDKRGFDDTLAMAACAVPAELRETTFALCADLVFADGSVESQEMAFLEAVQHALEIPDALALKVAEILQIKNRG